MGAYTAMQERNRPGWLKVFQLRQSRYRHELLVVFLMRRVKSDGVDIDLPNFTSRSSTDVTSLPNINLRMIDETNLQDGMFSLE